MNNKAVVTLADSTYFEMLIELVDLLLDLKKVQMLIFVF